MVWKVDREAEGKIPGDRDHRRDPQNVEAEEMSGVGERFQHPLFSEVFR